MGSLFIIPGVIIYVIGGLWGLIICLQILADAWGWFLALLSLFLLPAVVYLVPLYAGFAHSNWFPALLVYGASIIAMTLFGIGTKLNER